MTKGDLIFDGNEKQIFATDQPDRVIFRYKDVAVAYNNVKRARFKGKGALNNQISAMLLDYLNRNGVETHFIERLGEQEQLCRKIEIIPLQVVVHNRIAGSLATRLGVEEGFRHPNTIVDMRYNDDDLEDPFIGRHRAGGHEARVRPGHRHGRHHHLRRDQPGYLPAVGRGYGGADGQRPLPPGPEPRGGELYQRT